MKWAIEVQRTSLNTRMLGDLLTELGCTLFEHDERLAIGSLEADECVTSIEVFEWAKRVRNAFRGPANVDATFELGPVLEFVEGVRRHHILELVGAIARAHVSSGTLVVGPPPNLSADELAQWNADAAERKYQADLRPMQRRLRAAYINPNAVRVMTLLNAERSTGESLFKIYEIMSAGDPGFRKKFGISNEEFDRFSDAVHNYAVSGEFARHATNQTPRSSNPMTPEEARAFIKRIAELWIGIGRNEAEAPTS